MAKILASLSVFHAYASTTSASLVAVAGGQVRIDTAHFDGNPVYTLTARIRNASATETITLELQPLGGGTPIHATFSDTGSTAGRSVSIAITPTAGANTYQLYWSVTGAAQARLFSVDISVECDATCTKFATDLPMVYNGSPTTTPGEMTGTTRWLNEASKRTNCTMELHTEGNRGAGGTVTFELYTGSAARATTTHSLATNDLQIASVSGLVDAEEHYIRGTASTGTDVLSKAVLRFIYSAIDKAQIYRQVGQIRADENNDWANSTISTVRNCLSSRQLIDLSKYDAAYISGVYFEFSGLSAAASGDDVLLVKVGSTTSGVGTKTTVQTLANTSATILRVRGADLKGSWANEQHYAVNSKGATAGNAQPRTAVVIIDFAIVSSGNPQYYQQQQLAAA